MSAPIDAPDDVSLQPSDRYLTPSWITDKIRLVHPGGIDLDPFHDPHGSTGAKLMIDAREGGNAYRDPWPGVVVFAMTTQPQQPRFDRLGTSAAARVVDGFTQHPQAGLQIVAENLMSLDAVARRLVGQRLAGELPRRRSGVGKLVVGDHEHQWQPLNGRLVQ